jgi:hypothetical protein
VKITVEVLCKEYAIKENAFVVMDLENVLMIARLEEHVYKKPMKQFVNVIQDFLELTAPKKDAQMIVMIMEFV